MLRSPSHTFVDKETQIRASLSRVIWPCSANYRGERGGKAGVFTYYETIFRAGEIMKAEHMNRQKPIDRRDSRTILVRYSHFENGSLCTEGTPEKMKKGFPQNVSWSHLRKRYSRLPELGRFRFFSHKRRVCQVATKTERTASAARCHLRTPRPWHEPRFALEMRF